MASCGGAGADYSGGGGKDDNSDKPSRARRYRKSTWNTMKSITNLGRPRNRERGHLSGTFASSGTSDNSQNDSNTVVANLPSTADLSSTATPSTATPPTFSAMQSAGTSLTIPKEGASEPQSEADEPRRIDDGMPVSIENGDPVIGNRVATGISQTDGAEDSAEEVADVPVPRGFAGPDEYQEMLREEAQRQANPAVVESSGNAFRRGLAKVKKGLKCKRSDRNTEG